MTHETNKFFTSDTINQDGDVAYRTVSPALENSENKILNNTCDEPVITNQGGHVANDTRAHLN